MPKLSIKKKVGDYKINRVSICFSGKSFRSVAAGVCHKH